MKVDEYHLGELQQAAYAVAGLDQPSLYVQPQSWC